MTLQEFYADRFGSDPFSLLEAARDELTELAKMAGINWPACADNIQLNPRGGQERYSTYNGPSPEALEKSLKGRVEIYSRLEHSKDGISYPFINFVQKGSDAGSWSGFSFLFSEYRRDQQKNHATVVAQPAEERARIERQAEARRRRAEQQRINDLRNNQLDHERLLGWLAFHHAWEHAPAEDGSWPYAVKKGIRDVFSACDVRRVTSHDSARWSSGPTTYMAIPLSHLDGRKDGQIVGWQRIDKRGGKFQTNAVITGDFVGSCFVIGNLKGAQNIAVAEGFATGASVWLATRKDPKKRFDAVVVAVSANNMIHVVEQLVNLYPAAKITCTLDNDRKSSAEGKGNTGLRTGYEIIAKFNGIKCVYPIFEDDPQLECSDFNDLHKLRGLRETTRQLFGKANRLSTSTDLLTLTLNKLKTIKRDNRRTFAKELLQAVDIGMLTCPVPNSPSDLFKMFCIVLREMDLENVYRATIKDHIARRLNRKCRTAQAPRSFSDRITDPNKRPQHITYKRFETSVMTEEVLQYVQQLQGIVIVRAGMGSGKSTGLLRPLMHDADRGVSVAHRVSLIGGLWEMMTEKKGAKADILHYQDPGYQEMAPYANKLTICINSIVKGCWQPLMRQHDYFGFDEATQGLRAILSGKAMENPVAVFNTLIDALARTELHPIMVDADANDLLVDLAELAMKRREEMGLPAWLQIHVIELPVDVRNRETGEPIRVFYTEKDRIMTEVIKAVELGEKIMLATDSSTFAEDVTATLRQRYPEKKFLCVNQKSKPEPEVEAFTNKPKQMVKKYDGLIYSPSISSGVSIEQKHFDRHFGMFCGEVVPSDAIQMLRRDRTAKEFIIGFDKVRAKRETDPKKIERAFAQALLATAGMNGEVTDVVFDGDRISMGVANTDFTRMKIKAAAIEASARNDYACNMICIMHSDGYKVAPLASDELANSIGKELRKEAREIVWEQTLDLHLNIETPDESEREEILKKRALTLEEQAKLVRWDIENELKIPVNEDNLKFYFDGARDKVRRYETMLLDEVTARRYDREESAINFTYAFKQTGQWQYFVVTAMTREQADEAFQAKHPGITDYKVKATPAVEVGMRGFYALKSAALRQYFIDCGIDPETMTGEATQARMKYARDKLMTDERRDLLNNVLRIGGFMTPKGKPKVPEALFKNICESLGLKTDKRRAREGDKRPTIRFVDPESAAFMMEILENRQEDGLSLQLHKGDKKATEVDHGLDLNIYMDHKTRSTDGQNLDAPHSVISEALATLPVPVPEAWAMTALSDDELATMNTWSPASIAMTFASLYLTEFMDRLSSNELRRLREYITGMATGGYDAPEAFYG
ncbi:origin of replication binding family protein (plasmid) [Citrobacter freundii]|jgi:putative DNA primase/helicase|uniref:Origin of replication binding family protein n=1 Tax=Citrobacter freundii TaxID=546 RepID=A0AB33GTL3_CITFR|nr:plasmid replication protein, CyRepA1 family [Citrobacter freundii]AXZ45999.1 origin of replication binding family protein [Citrobacter freundii]EKT9390083.1 origin of replication binding family protein [Citrobacter freundii]EKU1809537.1 origin of replication binding family protein [Citrobacter freundii]EKW3169738.1 origin of replication binding family protein [Citrobacter freundii]EKX8167432.1 origin of replication binding family protein [Citrobacter freundii]